ncbi:hypothetical protein [Bartonella sp. MM73XJBT]|nr:hypothetical protein [Bartonella sp. MM73XJBT]
MLSITDKNILHCLLFLVRLPSCTIVSVGTVAVSHNGWLVSEFNQ